MATTAINLKNWSDVHYGSASEAILCIDLAVQNAPEEAENILGTAWTAVVMLGKPGIYDPRWFSTLSRFHKLAPAELARVRDAIEMRQRAFERRAA